MPAWLTVAFVACRETLTPVPPELQATGPVSTATELPSPVEVLATARIGAVGDVMMHGQVQRTAREAATDTNHGGFDVLWQAVAPDVRAFDVAFANLETPVAPSQGAGVREMDLGRPHRLRFCKLSLSGGYLHRLGKVVAAQRGVWRCSPR